MADAVTFEASRRDVNAIMDQIQRAHVDLKKSLIQSVRWAAFSVAQALGKSTRVSKKVRTIKQIRLNRKDWGAVREYAAGRKQFDVTSYVGGKEKHFELTAASLSQARRNKAAQVKRWGLAKAAWGWGIKLLRRGGAIGISGPRAKRDSRKYLYVQEQPKGDNPQIRMTNKLRYATTALEGGLQGTRSVMARAAKSMKTQIDANIAKKLAKK